MTELSILIPAFNEERRIEKTLNDMISFFDGKNLDYEIVVAVDRGDDDTEGAVKKISEKNPQVKLNFSDKKQKLFSGKGSAVKRAFEQSGGERIIFADADGSASPDQLWLLLKELGNYDVVAGSRAMPGSIVEGQPAYRNVAGHLFSFMLRILFLFPVRDTQCGYKAFRRYVLENVFPKVKSLSSTTDSEILIRSHMRGYRIKEMPIIWRHVKDSTKTPTVSSTIRLGVNMGVELLKIRYRTLFDNEK